MKAVKKCRSCGKSIPGGYLCEECERKVLETHRGRRYLLSGATGIILIALIYVVWTEYQEKRGEIDLSVFSRFSSAIAAYARAVLASPYLLIPLVIVMIIAAFIIGTRLSK
ncbi:MAG: hypothetical protein D6733_05685 [Methanobacteriota archaeon]|nr:MAG: hypothetical protein D6733_05685 [Euryarchaeota archaeon]